MRKTKTSQKTKKAQKARKAQKAKKLFLLTPGPVVMPSVILNKLSEPMIHHRDSDFIKIFQETKVLLKKVFQTREEVFILNSSGTGAMSSALLNTLSPGDTVLILQAGKFGERWAEMAQAYGLKTLTVKAKWGKAVSVQKAKAVLDKNPQVKAVLAQACETATGVLHPVRELAFLTKNRPGCLFILDAISAVGAVDIPMDRWGIDIMIGGSQKSFCLPAGMAFIALSKKAWRFSEKARLPVYYLDLKKEKVAGAKGQTAFSSNVSFIRALHTFLKPVGEKEGLKKRIQKVRKLFEITLKFCESEGLRVFADPPSPSVVSIALPKHIDGVKLKKHIEKKYRVIVGGGQGKLKGRIIRVGCLGHVSPAELKACLKCIALAFRDFSPPRAHQRTPTMRHKL